MSISLAERNEKMRGRWIQTKGSLLLVSALFLLLQGCEGAMAPLTGGEKPVDVASEPPTDESKQEKPTDQKEEPPMSTPATPADQPQQDTTAADAKGTATPSEIPQDLALEVVAEPASLTVLVNKQRKLPEEYKPTDLVFPNVPFLAPEKSERRMLREEAARALEQMFAAAQADGIALAGVSGYRSHEYQKTLFARYVAKDGLEKARTYSAYPGTSEHETGLAIDISGIDGKCAAESCFAGTPEAEWLAARSMEFGFIVRYPLGKEEITGYIYEPWHLRYVGVELAQELAKTGLTLEEYFGATPVSSEG